MEDCNGNPVCATSARGGARASADHGGQRPIDSRRPEMLEVLRWLDSEMDCRDNFGGCLFSIQDFEKVRRAIKLAWRDDGK